MREHTKGPWECVECEFGDYQTGEVGFVVSSKTERMVASVANCKLIASAPALAAKVERLREVVQNIAQWSEAYPLEIFPEPDLKKAHEVLTAAGMTLDAISAYAMRHVITQVGKMAKDALARQEAGPDLYPNNIGRL